MLDTIVDLIHLCRSGAGGYMLVLFQRGDGTMRQPRLFVPVDPANPDPLRFYMLRDGATGEILTTWLKRCGAGEAVQVEERVMCGVDPEADQPHTWYQAQVFEDLQRDGWAWVSVEALLADDARQLSWLTALVAHSLRAAWLEERISLYTSAAMRRHGSIPRPTLD